MKNIWQIHTIGKFGDLVLCITPFLKFWIRICIRLIGKKKNTLGCSDMDLRYMKGTSMMSLKFGRYTNSLIEHCNWDYGGDLEICIHIGWYTRLVTSLQDVMIMSMTEVEFIVNVELLQRSKVVKGSYYEIVSWLWVWWMCIVIAKMRFIWQKIRIHFKEEPNNRH